MAENVTIARPYAEAAFQLASRAGALGPWSEALDRLASMAADPQMRDCISDPKLSSRTTGRAFPRCRREPDCLPNSRIMSAFLSKTSVCSASRDP